MLFRSSRKPIYPSFTLLSGWKTLFLPELSGLSLWLHSIAKTPLPTICSLKWKRIISTYHNSHNPSLISPPSWVVAISEGHGTCHQEKTQNQQSGSLPLTIEEVMAHFANADVWVGSSANSLDELARIDNKHTLFKAFQEKRIYNFNKRITPQGANDFWELGLTRPDLLLADLISILHPDLLTEHQSVFTKQLQ